LPDRGILSAAEKELISLGLLDIAIVGPDDPPEDRRHEIRISDAGTQLVEKCNILALVEMGAILGDSRVFGLVKKVPKEQLPVLLASSYDVVRRAAKDRLEDGVD